MHHFFCQREVETTQVPITEEMREAVLKAWAQRTLRRVNRSYRTYC